MRRPQPEPAPEGRQHVTVVLLADEGLPAAVAARLAEDLPALLARHLGDDVRWSVDARPHTLPLEGNGEIPMHRLAAQSEHHHADAVVLLTDLPRRLGTQPVVAEYSRTGAVALVSLPALGSVAVTHKARDLLIHLLAHQLRLTPAAAARAGSPARVPTWIQKLATPTRHVDSQADGIDGYLALIGLRGRVRLLAGMVRDNRPWRLVPQLASATAAAAATAAFGIFYSSIWNMADALPLWRLALITLVAITALVAWLLFYNHLWDRPATLGDRKKAVLYNAATVLTLLTGVGCMYAMLYLLAFTAAVAVIDVNYLQTQLHHAAGIGDYARLTWLACSMGIVAGALGSSLEGEDAVRRATYSKRERERQARTSG